MLMLTIHKVGSHERIVSWLEVYRFWKGNKRACRSQLVSKWRILGISCGLTQYGQLQLGHCCILPPAPAGPPGGAMEAG